MSCVCTSLTDSQFQYSISRLNSPKEHANLYSMGNFARRRCALYDAVSNQKFIVFSFSLDNS